MGVYPNMMQPIPYFKYNNRTGKKFQKEQPQGNDDESQLTEHQQQVHSQEHDDIDQQAQPQNEA